MKGLLVIDVQKDFVDILSSPVYIPGARKIIPPLRQAVSLFRQMKLPVIFILTLHKKDRSDWGLVDLERGRAYCIENSKGIEPIDEIKPDEGDFVVYKARYSGFYNTNLDEVLKQNGINELFFSGLTTECCVGSTARDAYFRNYKVNLLEDCSTATHPISHNSEVIYFRKSLGRVLDVDVMQALFQDHRGDMVENII